MCVPYRWSEFDLKKIGILGGTFDPVHKGHMELARTAIEKLQIDEFWFVPNGKPPHKQGGLMSFDRYNMVKELIPKYDIDGKMKISDFELYKEGASYTYETLTHFKGLYPACELIFIIGMDNLNEISSWKNPDEIFKLATVAVFDRAGYEKDEKIILDLEIKYGATLKFFDFDFPISSTEIKEMLKKGDNVLNYLDITTLKYIFRNGLYDNPPVSEYDFYDDDLKNFIEQKRYDHSIGVAVTAYILAIRYKEDVKLAYLTGLLHDIAKRLPIEKQMELCKNMKLYPDELLYPKMLHSPAGAALVEQVYNITDKKILNAIRLHTIGSGRMTVFDKIIYLADYIEPCRDFENLTELRKLAFCDMDRALIRGVDITLLSLVAEGNKISPILLNLRNELIDIQSGV